MSLFSLLSFFAFLVYLSLGVHVLRLDKKGPLNRIFFVLCLGLTFWAFCTTFLFSSTDKETCWYWLRLSSFGWCLVPGLLLHFFLQLTASKALKKLWLYPVLYLPGIVFLCQSFIGHITVKDFLKQGLTWSAVAALDSPWFWAYSAYYLGFSLLGTVLVWRWGKSSGIPKVKKQANLIVTTACIAILLSFVNQTLLPLLHFDLLPGIPSILILIWVFGIWFSIARYKLMVLTPSIAADEIITHIMDLLILADNKGEILKINRQIQEILGYSEEELLKTSISEMFLEQDVSIQEFIQQKNTKNLNRICELTYKAKNGDKIPVVVSGSAIRDQEGEPIGVVIVGHDMRQTKQLQGEIKERMRIEEEVRSLNGELEKRVVIRTNELAIANETLRFRSEFEQLIALISTDFINLPYQTVDSKVEESLRRVGEFLGIERALIRLPETFLEWTTREKSLRQNNFIEDFPWAKSALVESESLVIPNVSELPEVAGEEKAFLQSEGIGSLVVIPLRSGYFELHAERDSEYCSPESVALLKMLGQILFNALERKTVEEALLSSEQRYRELFENANDIVYTLDLEGNFTTINQAGISLSGYSREEILKMNMLEIIGMDHIPLVQRMMSHKLDGETLQTTYELGLVTKDDRKLLIETSSRLMYQDGIPVGVQGIARDVTERKRMEERLNYLAFHDDLTGLPNRPLFHDRLSQALQRADQKENEVVVMLLDIDRFKEINDTLGHDTGDRLLQAVAHRLSAGVRMGDTMARTSGDEFFFVFSDIENQEAAQAAATRIQEAFELPFMVDDNEFFITPSIGVSRYPHDGSNAENLIKSAEMAMYWAKEQGKNNHQFFTTALSTAAATKRTLEYQLRKAIEKEEFEVYYQPQVELKTGKLIGCEALLRWHHPERGLLSPAHFMGVAEENGFIIPIGEWTLRKACAQNKAWQDEGLYPIRMAVNLSARQFHQSQQIQKDLITTVSQALEETKLSPNFLELEITESIAMRNIEDTIRILAQLHELGVKLSIDDFGTGYSSLAYLKRFPIDALKVDRAFVKDVIDAPDDAAIVEAILAMARSLKLQVIAEGVEQESQLNFLHALGCDEVQGYYFSKPLPADSFRDFLLQPSLWDHQA